MKNTTAWPEINLNRSAGAPTLRHQIAGQIAAAIRNGNLPGGSRLPSSRLLARLLHVSRGTVVDAYEALLERGLIIATAGSGVRVAHRSPCVPNLGNLKRAAAAAHYPARVCRFEDRDGTALYLNVVH